ncbi:MAG TPA: EFR1 family ferrodoxin [Syntrophorhabdales bacterium]|nr:EFR1 family ferrodoxin [Syntrophorhabdales bacterium]
MRSVCLIYFSPTGTTRKVLEAIATGIVADDVNHVDLTREVTRATDSIEIKSDIAIIGTPVYSGRVPLRAIEALQRIKAQNTPAVVVAVYGNRAYDDALLELTELAKQCGFKPVAAAAFIGEHSFSTSIAPIAEGRPDREDIKKAENFGKVIRQKIGKGIAKTVVLQVPGNFPYKARNPSPPPPITDEANCIKCANCVTICPAQAVTIRDDTVLTENARCMACCACVKNCPSGARRVHPKLAERAQTLSTTCRDRKGPEFFI